LKITSLYAKTVDDHVNELTEDVVSLWHRRCGAACGFHSRCQWRLSV